MKLELVSFEVAKILKEKGFNIPSGKMYQTPVGNLINPEYSYKSDIQAPTLALVQKWLRGVHDIYVTIGYEGEDSDSYCFAYTIQHENTSSKEKKLYKRMITDYSRQANSGYWDTYEQALEQGIIEALKLLNK